jgi:hypothetical protein
MARINALNKLPGCLRFIMLLFLAIETSPIIAKLFSKGEYDFKLEDLETALKAIEQDKYQRTLLVKTSAAMHDKVYEDIAQDKTSIIYSEKCS